MFPVTEQRIISDTSFTGIERPNRPIYCWFFNRWNFDNIFSRQFLKSIFYDFSVIFYTRIQTKTQTQAHALAHSLPGNALLLAHVNLYYVVAFRRCCLLFLQYWTEVKLLHRYHITSTETQTRTHRMATGMVQLAVCLTFEAIAKTQSLWSYHILCSSERTSVCACACAYEYTFSRTLFACLCVVNWDGWPVIWSHAPQIHHTFNFHAFEITTKQRMMKPSENVPLLNRIFQNIRFDFAIELIVPLYFLWFSTDLLRKKRLKNQDYCLGSDVWDC